MGCQLRMHTIRNRKFRLKIGKCSQSGWDERSVPPLQLKTIPSSSQLDSSKEGEMMSRIISESRWQKKLPYALYTVCGWHCYPDITAHVQICLQTWYFRITLFSKIVGKIPLNIFPTFVIKYKEQEHQNHNMLLTSILASDFWHCLLANCQVPICISHTGYLLPSHGCQLMC